MCCWKSVLPLAPASLTQQMPPASPVKNMRMTAALRCAYVDVWTSLMTPNKNGKKGPGRPEKLHPERLTWTLMAGTFKRLFSSATQWFPGSVWVSSRE